MFKDESQTFLVSHTVQWLVSQFSLKQHVWLWVKSQETLDSCYLKEVEVILKGSNDQQFFWGLQCLKKASPQYVVEDTAAVH